MDQIKIKDLEIYGNHGVFPEENALGQKFLVTANLHVNTREAGISDDLTKSVNYGEVSSFIYDFVKNNCFKLLETVLEKLAEEILLTFPLVEKVDLTIKKPWAPIGLPLDTASVSITRGWHKAYVALGSNMGDSMGYLTTAVASLSEHPFCAVTKVSDYIVTKPYGGVEQDDFVNGALELKTLLTPHELLDLLHEIEQNAHRERIIHWGPRTLDLDILLYDDIVMNDEDLIIPHIDMHNRDFVLNPLCEIAPYAKHAAFCKTILQLKDELEAKSCQE